MEIKGDWHPHNLELNVSCYFGLITGPNMAGKTTVMREMAIIQFLAQVGSFVPAKKAIHVAKLAALPAGILKRATSILKDLEHENTHHNSSIKKDYNQIDMFPERTWYQKNSKKRQDTIYLKL